MITEQRDNMIGICAARSNYIHPIVTFWCVKNHWFKILKALDAFKGWLSPVKCFEFYLLHCSTFATGTPNVLKSTCLITLMMALTQFTLWGHWCWITLNIKSTLIRFVQGCFFRWAGGRGGSARQVNLCLVQKFHLWFSQTYPEQHHAMNRRFTGILQLGIFNWVNTKRKLLIFEEIIFQKRDRAIHQEP